MSEETGLPENRITIRAEGQAKVNAVGSINNANRVHVGNRYESQCQIPPPIVENITYVSANRVLASWVDRAQVQDELLQRVENAQGSLVELVASGGFGKSSLAVWVGEQAESQGDKVIWVGLSLLTRFSEFAQWVLYELCVPTEDRMTESFLIDQLVFHLRKRCCLVVIDQLEKIVESEERPHFEAFLAAWQQKGRRSTVLVTTRQRFLSQEVFCFPLSGLLPMEGEAFLQKRGITTALSDGLQQLSTVCDGHPLLLNLSASWLQETAAQRLNQEDLIFFERLFQNDLGNSEAQVGEIFSLLLERLPARLRSVLLEVSVYRLPFDLAQAQVMQPEVTDVDVAALEKQGFLLGQVDRWRLHPLVSQLVAAALESEALEVSAHGKAIAYFEAQFQAETTDIQDYLECFHHYCECGDYEAAFDILNRCFLWLDLGGYYRILVDTYERLFLAWQASPPQSKENQEKNWVTLTRLGNAYYSLGEYRKAIAFQEQSLEVAREIGNRNGEASSFCNLGTVYNSLGEYRKAIAFQEQSLEITREIGDQKGEASSFCNLGNAYWSLGEYGKAIAFHEQSLEIIREIGDQRGEASSLGNLGNAYKSLGEYRKAIAFQEQSLEIQREIGDQRGEASSFCNLGNAYWSLGEYGKAIAFHEQSLEITREIGDQRGEASSLGNLGNAYKSLGECSKAIAFQEQSLEIQREIGDQRGEASSLGNLGIAYKSLGEYGKAIAFQKQSLEIRREIGDRNGEAISLFNLGITYAKIDEHWKSREHYEQAKDLFTELKLAHMVEKCEKAIQERNLIIARTPQNSRSKWWPYIAIAVAIILLILFLQ